MGPAILLCPSSAAHLWGQVSPLKKTRQKDRSISLSHGYPRCSAHVHCTGDLIRRPAFFFNPASTSAEKCRKPNYPFAWRRVSAAAAGGEVSVEEVTTTTGEAPAKESISPDPSNSTEGIPVAVERKTQARRTLNRSNSNANKAAVVSPAELLPGAAFPGKVTAIQTFGAFVDFGAFTNGLVHISRLSKSYVKKVEDVVQVGQDVKVQVLEVDLQANRISLMLVEEATEGAQQEGEAAEKQPSRPSQARSPRRDSSKRPSPKQAVTTMKKGEIVTGTVKNIIKSGVFVSLPDGTDGYLPGAEVVFKGPNTNLDAQFQVGQEITVRVLRIERGRVNLSMKREMNYDKLNEDINKDVVDGATNPFEIAFRRNELIASFLSERDKQKTQVESKDDEKKEEPVEATKDEAVSLEADAEKGTEEGTDGMVAPVEEKDDEKKEEPVEATKDEAVSLEADAEKGTEEDTNGMVAPVEEKVAEASKDEVVASEVDAEKLTEEGTDAVEKAITAVEEAIEEQVVAVAEGVANLVEEVSAEVQAVLSETDAENVTKEGTNGMVAPVEEKVVEASKDEAVASEVDVQKLTEEGTDAVKEAVTAVEKAIVEQAVAAAEEVANLVEEVSVNVQAEDVVKDVEEPGKEVPAKEAEAKETEPLVSGEKEEQVAETSTEVESPVISSEAELKSETVETQDPATSDDDTKDVTNDSPILLTSEVVGVNVQQS